MRARTGPDGRGFVSEDTYRAYHELERLRATGRYAEVEAAKAVLREALQVRSSEPFEVPEAWRLTSWCHCADVQMEGPVFAATLTPNEPWDPEAWGPDSIFSPAAEARRAERLASHRNEHTD